MRNKLASCLKYDRLVVIYMGCGNNRSARKGGKSAFLGSLKYALVREVSLSYIYSK